MSYTTKSRGRKRQMKSVEDWYGLNKTTPDKWFERWTDFLVSFMCELSYQRTGHTDLEKPRGKAWVLELNFSHPHLPPVVLKLSRIRKQEGGTIHFVYRCYPNAYSASIDTLSQTNHGAGNYSVMSRQKVGDEILHHVREGWAFSK